MPNTDSIIKPSLTKHLAPPSSEMRLHIYNMPVYLAKWAERGIIEGVEPYGRASGAAQGPKACDALYRELEFHPQHLRQATHNNFRRSDKLFWTPGTHVLICAHTDWELNIRKTNNLCGLSIAGSWGTVLSFAFLNVGAGKGGSIYEVQLFVYLWPKNSDHRRVGSALLEGRSLQLNKWLWEGHIHGIVRKEAS